MHAARTGDDLCKVAEQHAGDQAIGARGASGGEAWGIGTCRQTSGLSLASGS
jgi:hypothetical protein